MPNVALRLRQMRHQEHPSLDNDRTGHALHSLISTRQVDALSSYIYGIFETALFKSPSWIAGNMLLVPLERSSVRAPVAQMPSRNLPRFEADLPHPIGKGQEAQSRVSFG